MALWLVLRKDCGKWIRHPTGFPGFHLRWKVPLAHYQHHESIVISPLKGWSHARGTPLSFYDYRLMRFKKITCYPALSFCYIQGKQANMICVCVCILIEYIMNILYMIHTIYTIFQYLVNINVMFIWILFLRYIIAFYEKLRNNCMYILAHGILMDQGANHDFL